MDKSKVERGYYIVMSQTDIIKTDVNQSDIRNADKSQTDTGRTDVSQADYRRIYTNKSGLAAPERREKIGIMGGTFNPIHIGHLIIAEDICEKANLDKVLFIPSGQPPHKPDSEVAAAEHRYEMVRLAVASNSNFEASRIELDRDGYTYTINTLLELREKYGRNTDIYFIIGADVVHELKTWREYERVFALCEFIAVLRPGFDENALKNTISQLAQEHGAVIHPVTSRLIDISSTDIRERCRNGKSIRYLVPEPVEEYILRNGLYRAEK